MIPSLNSSVKRSGTLNHYVGDLLPTMRISQLSRMRTEAFQLLVIPCATSSTYESPAFGPWQPWRSFDLGALPRVALLTDVPQSATFSAGIFLRNRTEIAGDLFATAEPLRFSEEQHEGQGLQSTHPRMGHQALRLGTVFRFLLDRVG
jgi:hypothetical protein